MEDKNSFPINDKLNNKLEKDNEKSEEKKEIKNLEEQNNLDNNIKKDDIININEINPIIEEKKDIIDNKENLNNYEDKNNVNEKGDINNNIKENEISKHPTVVNINEINEEKKENKDEQKNNALLIENKKEVSSKIEKNINNSNKNDDDTNKRNDEKGDKIKEEISKEKNNNHEQSPVVGHINQFNDNKNNNLISEKSIEREQDINKKTNEININSIQKSEEKENIENLENINTNLNINDEMNTNNNQILEEEKNIDNLENINTNLNINDETNKRNNNSEIENEHIYNLVRDFDQKKLFDQGNQGDIEGTNELAKAILETGDQIKKRKEERFNHEESLRNREFNNGEIANKNKEESIDTNIRTFFEKEQKERRKKKLEQYSKNIDNLLESMKKDWLSEDRNGYITRYEYKYMNEMNELFNKMNEDLSIKDEVVCKIFKFICEYFQSRKDFLCEIPWVEINNLRKILVKENFEGICVLHNEGLLTQQYEELLVSNNIEKTEENIIEYNNNNFFKYLLEFLFRIGFFESFIEKAYDRDDEIFHFQAENSFPGEVPSFLEDFINLLCYPIEVFSYCKKGYLLKMNYCEKYMNKFLIKIEKIIKLSAFKEELKKQFFNIMSDKYRYIIDNIFKNFDDSKNKKIPIWENFCCYTLMIAENYLTQQKLESRIYGLNLISRLTEIFKNVNEDVEYANKLSFMKESIVKYMNKINIYNLIFGENIHEALVHRAYNLLYFLYKNNSFNKEQIKHLWFLSQDKYQTISDNIIELFGKLLPEFSIDDSNEILKIVSDMNLSEVNEETLKLLENFFNSKQRNEKLYKILYKFSDELTFNEGLNKNIIIKSRNILVKLLFNQIYMKDLINIIKKCIFNIGKNYLVNTSLSILKLIIEEFHRNENSPEVKIIFSEINPNITNLELLIKYLEKKGNLFSVLFTTILDNEYLLQFLLEETKNLSQLINNNDNFDSELMKILDEMYKKFIEPENGYYYNYGLNGHIQGQNININPIRQISSNQLDKTQSTEKSLNEGLIGEEEDNDGNNQNIINNNEDIFNNDSGNWEFEINPEKYFKNIFKEYILFLKKISKKNNFLLFSENELIEYIFNQFEFPFTNKNHYQNINDLLEIIISFFVMGKMQIQLGHFKFLNDVLINNSITNQEKIIYYKFLTQILKKQDENQNILIISDKVLTELILDKLVKYDSSLINQLPLEAFEFFKLFIIYFNQKHGNIYYSNATKKIISIERYDLLVGTHILENYFIYTKDDKIYNESLDLLTNILSVAAEKITNRKKILDKIFTFLKNNLSKIKNDNEVKIQIIREIKLISIINSTKVKDLYDEEDKESLIQINVVNKILYGNNENNDNNDINQITISKNMKIKDLKNIIMNEIILTQKNIEYFNEKNKLEHLSLSFSPEEVKQEISKKGFNINYKNQDLDENSTLNDYNIEKDDFISIIEKKPKINQIYEVQISEEKLNEEYVKVKGIFTDLDDEIIKLAIKKNNGNTEETIMFLTEENKIASLKKEIEENKKKEKNENIKKVKKEEEFIPLEEDKINLLFEILNQEDNSINEEIWKLLGSIKYPDNLINKATSEELMNVISEPNLYKMLLNLKLVNSLIFDDKFCKFNKIPNDKKLNWTSIFVKNESFVNTILNKMNNIGEIKEQNEIIEIKEKDQEKKNEKSLGEKQVLKFQILSIFTNWFHNIFINMLPLIKNEYIQPIINDIKQCNSFTLHNQNNNDNQNQINNINNDNKNEQHKLEIINEKDAKKFIQILNKNNIVQLFYKIIKTSLSLTKDYKNIIQLVLEMQLIYFSINKKEIKYFINDETNNKILSYLITTEKNKDIRTMVLNFFKILVKNLNSFQTKKISKNKDEIKNNEKKFIDINEVNENEIREIKNKENDLYNEENKDKINEENQNKYGNNKEQEKKGKNELNNQDIKSNIKEDNKEKGKNEVYDINEIINYDSNKENMKPAELPKKEKLQQENEEEEIVDDENTLFKILINLYKDKVISEELFSQEFYVLYSFLLGFKEILFKNENKEQFLIEQEISFLITHIYKYSLLQGDEFIQKKFNLMYNIYLLSSCCKYYSPLIKDYMEKNSQIDLNNLLYDGLFEVIKNPNNITSYKFDWDNLRKHSYNLLSNIIFLDNKYLNKWLPKILSGINNNSQKKLKINIDFKLRDSVHDKLIGLKNFGATCYLNSLFQQMYMNPIFSKDLLSFDFSTVKDFDINSSVVYNMQLGFANLKYSCLSVYPPSEFIKSFKKAFNGQPIQIGVQQDSDEFLSILCDELEKEAKLFNKENFLNNSFKGKISNEIVSLNKDYPYYSKTDEDFYRVTLDIKGHKTLQEALDAYIKGEILDGDNQYYVEKYKKKLPIRKSSSLKILGNQVIIHLKRFEFDFVTFTNKKLSDYLEFPFEINFKKWTRAYLRSTDPNLKPELLNITEEEKENLEEEKMNYVLTGILIHSGSSLQSGHYYSLIVDQESGKWYQFNDNNITEFNIERDLEKECFGIKESKGGEQFGRTAYLLFYTKKSLFRNEKVLKGININLNIINEVHKENIRYLEIKTYSSNLYQEFLIKLVNNCLKNCKDSNIEKENSIIRKYREQIKLFEIVQKMQKVKEKAEIYENINKIEDEKEEKKETKSQKEFIIPDNIEEIINKLKEEENNKKNEQKVKEYTNKKIIKSLIFYTFKIATQYFDNNSRIASLLKTINNYISSNKIYCLTILKAIEKDTEMFVDYFFSCGGKSQDMQGINSEIFDLFNNIFGNVYIYEKENLQIISNKFSYICKNEKNNKYEVMQEYESCLFRCIKKMFCKNLERCRKEYSKDLMFLHLFRFCSGSFPEVSIILEDYLIPLISFITNNKLSEPYFKSKENLTFHMGGHPNWKPNENYEIIFSDICIHSINDGMYQKKKLSPYFIGENQNYPTKKKYEIQEINKFDYYPRLPKNIFSMLSPLFIFDYLNSKNCTVEVLGNLCYENETFSSFLFKRINNYLKELNKNLSTFENIFNKICSVFKMDDSLNDLRLEKLFELGQENQQNLSLFDFYNNMKDQSDLILDFIYILSTVMFSYNKIFEYLYKYKSKLTWIYEYFKQIKNEGSRIRAYNVINSLHPEFIDIIEEGLINRLELAPKMEEMEVIKFDNGNDDGDDDDGFNLM